MLSFYGDTLKQICEDAIRRYPEECCGILLGKIAEDADREVKMIRPQINRAARDRRKFTFAISPKDYMREEILADQNGLEILGFYHSHPDEPADVSDADLNYMLPGLTYVILSVFAGKIRQICCFEKCICGEKEKLLKKCLKNGGRMR